ncbi:hypothetical protein GL218_08593 [Daldinia childiae]|uniref:uncharacterized protein n=1 Tax=Daldinia childiae TaxID=326645 RepID=UPI0014484F56|nr:uncharacterized protein GL218_08593 [Daldinia childiae]KAF3067258.1 hypothetical protein GL218_08593 [Daldinia childiae]
MIDRNGKPHEKADPLVVHRLRQILEPIRTEAEHESELLEDRDTTWFGFGRDAFGHPLFHDFGRFAAIMSETVTDETVERYPQLTTFIGETGAGKSTLIKLLIDRHDLTAPEGSNYYAPVTSSSHDRISTTGDVHLYADPSTLYSSHPLLLVDCEGLSGGEAIPKQLRHHPQVDKSLNQPVLPHAIIVFNATDINVDEREWDITMATKLLMADIHDAVTREPALQEYGEQQMSRHCIYR